MSGIPSPRCPASIGTRTAAPFAPPFAPPLARLFTAALFTTALLVSACGSSTPTRPIDASERIQQCKAGDQRVASESACLQDDAACYQIANGEWCTGERGNTCPAGSNALPSGAGCPPGAHCFRLGESLECAIPLG